MKNLSYEQCRKMIAKVTIFTLYFALFIYLFVSLQSTVFWDYHNYELLYILESTTLYLFAFEAIVWMYFAFRSLTEKSIKVIIKELRLKDILFKTAVLISLTLVIGFFYIETKDMFVSGIYSVDGKFKVNNSYYLILDTRKVKCTFNEYTLIEEGKEFFINYEWNTYLKNGELRLIEPYLVMIK